MIHRVPGHFGEWLQGRLGPDGPVALVTVACAALGVTAERLGDGPLWLDQRPEILTRAQAAHLLGGGGPAAGRFRLVAEMPPGGGAGASTAALVALARAAGLPEDALAARCLAIEGASDPVMFADPDARLWAPREARTLRALPPPPGAEIVGGFLGPPSRTDPADADFPDIADLAQAWADARALPEHARLASLSAERTAAKRGPAADPMPKLARELGALGHLRAHTGSARGLIFAPGTAPENAEACLAAAGLAAILRFRTGGPR